MTTVVSATPTAFGDFIVIVPADDGWVIAILNRSLRWQSATTRRTKQSAVALAAWMRKWCKVMKTRSRSAQERWLRRCPQPTEPQ